MAHFLRMYSHNHGKQIPGFTRRASDALLKYDYPGNIRELQNLIERGVVYAEDGQLIDVVHMFLGSENLSGISHFLDPAGYLVADGTPLVDTHAQAQAPLARPSEAGFEALERATYEEAMRKAGGNVAAAARALKLSRAKLEYRLQRLGYKR